MKPLSILCFAVVSLLGTTSNAATSRAVIFCGLAGDAEHEAQFATSVATIHKALTERFGFQDSNVKIYFGRAEDEASSEAFATHGRCVREDFDAAAKWLIKATGKQDRAWVFVIGHSYFDGKTVHFNIPDKDITHREFGQVFTSLGGRSTFFICTPVSGFYLRELSKPNRIIITSTEADLETNGSIYHTALAETFSEISGDAKYDLDQDGRVSWFDFYVLSTRKLSDMYLTNDPPLIATEHPQLDDNGDGRGSEVQIDYLTTAQGGRSDAKRKSKLREFKDGKLAAKLSIELEAGKK